MGKLEIRYINANFIFYFRFPQLHFDYKDPEKNFDRNKVHGLVCKLIKVKEVRAATALEVAAGGKVNMDIPKNIVVLTLDFLFYIPRHPLNKIGGIQCYPCTSVRLSVHHNSSFISL